MRSFLITVISIILYFSVKTLAVEHEFFNALVNPLLFVMLVCIGTFIIVMIFTIINKIRGK